MVKAYKSILKDNEGQIIIPYIPLDSAPVEGSENAISSDAVFQALKAVYPIGSIFSSLTSIPPEGAYLLNGQTIPNCAEAYKKFWAWVQSAGVRIIDNDTYEAELAKYGVCGGFVINSAMGSVRLPKWHYQAPLGATLPVRGNGIALGLTDGTQQLGLYGASNSATLATHTKFYGQPVGGDISQVGLTLGACVGVTTDPDTSGIVAENNAPADPFVWCIQVYNAATALSEQESAQLASLMQMKAQTDLANVSENLDFVVDTWRSADGSSWYRKYRSGWVEQGIRCVKNGTTALPVEMADANYSTTLSPYGSTIYVEMGFAVEEQTTTSVTTKQTYTDTLYACIKGYAATE